MRKRGGWTETELGGGAKILVEIKIAKLRKKLYGLRRKRGKRKEEKGAKERKERRG